MALSGISLSLSLVGQGRLELHRLYIRQVLSPIELLTVERMGRIELPLSEWHSEVTTATPHSHLTLGGSLAINQGTPRAEQ